jgi:chromosome segregation ATPase
MSRYAMFAPVLSLLLLAGCDSGEKKSIADQIGPPTKSLADLKQESTVSKEEQERIRKEMGFVNKADKEKEEADKIAKEMEASERAWIKTRLKDYRKLNEDTKKYLDDLEKEAGKWAAAKDPDKAFDKNGKSFQDRMKELIKQIDKLSERSTKGGNTQAEYNKLFRPLDESIPNIGPQAASDPAFTELLKNSRTQLDVLVKALDDIEKDETIEANKFHEGEGEGEAAEGDAKKKKKKGK